MKKLLFLAVILLSIGACTKFDPSQIKKLDNKYANNGIMRSTVLKYKYDTNGVLDSVSTDTISFEIYGLRGNLKYSLDTQSGEYFSNEFKGTTPTYAEVFNWPNRTFKHKIKYLYKGNTVTESYSDKNGNSIKKIVHYKDKSERDTAYITYSQGDKIIEKFANKYDSIGLKELVCTDFEHPELNYKRLRTNNNPLFLEFVHKDSKDSTKLDDQLIYDNKGRRTEFKRTIYGNGQNDVTIHMKYSYLTDDGLIDKIIFYDKTGKPEYIHQYTYDKYHINNLK